MTDKNLQNLKMYLCGKFSCSTPGCVGVRGQTDREGLGLLSI